MNQLPFVDTSLFAAFVITYLIHSTLRILLVAGALQLWRNTQPLIQKRNIR